MKTHHKVIVGVILISGIGIIAWNSEKSPTPPTQQPSAHTSQAPQIIKTAPSAPNQTPVAVSSGLCHAVVKNGVVFPDPTCTPGVFNPDVTAATANSNICMKGWSTKSIRPPVSYTNGLKMCELTGQGCEKYPGARQYDFTDQNPKDYELDHLISLTDGGSPTDPGNLWPEPYSPAPGAHEKDKAELVVHKDICADPANIDKYRTGLAQDWTQFYQSNVTLPAGSTGE